MVHVACPSDTRDHDAQCHSLEVNNCNDVMMSHRRYLEQLPLCLVPVPDLSKGFQLSGRCSHWDPNLCCGGASLFPVCTFPGLSIQALLKNIPWMYMFMWLHGSLTIHCCIPEICTRSHFIINYLILFVCITIQSIKFCCFQEILIQFAP